MKVENVCSKRDLYEVEYSDPKDDCVDRYYAQNLIERKLAEAESKISGSYSLFLQCCRDETFEGNAFRQGHQAVCELASNLIVRHPMSMRKDREQAREMASILQESKVLSEEDYAFLEWSGWHGDYQALAELSFTATSLFPDENIVPINRIHKVFLDKHLSVFKAPFGSCFITASMPLYIIGPEDDSYDFDFAYMPLSSEYAALFSSNVVAEPFTRLSLSRIEAINRFFLFNCVGWEFAMSRAKGPLDHALRGWKCLTSICSAK